MNPPYHPPISTASPDSKRSAATHGGEDLAFWAETAWRNLGRRGGVTLIWPTARLSEALAAINGRFG
jgi:tRNA1(Val) A37 N6-methylase TrmN6